MGSDNASQPGWHLSRGGKTYGPIPETKLFQLAGQGKIRPEDMVWKSGLETWQAAKSIPGLFMPPIPEPTIAAASQLREESVGKRRAPLFLVLGICALGLSLMTPRLLLFFPVMATLGFGVTSFFRRERSRWGAIFVIALAIGLVILNQVDLAAPTSTNLSAAQISDWNWQSAPDFGTRGTIKWNVSIRNVSTRNIDTAKVDFATYDAQGKLVSSTFTYVQAIPAGDVRTENSHADFYGIEKDARVKITEVRFAQ